MSSFLRRVSRDAHQVSKWAPRLAKRVVRRAATRSIFNLIRKASR